MSKLSTNRRNSLNDSQFGVSSLRKFPLTDKEHVLKAIQFFHHCPPEHKKELAHKINNASKKYGITITDNSKIYDYLNEMEQLEIDQFSEIYALEESLFYLNEGIMNEGEATAYVNMAIKCWNKRKSSIRNVRDKSKLVMDLKSEVFALRQLTTKVPPDFYSVILRAKETGNKMSAVNTTNDLSSINSTRGKSSYSSANSAIMTMGKGAAIAAGGLAVGGTLGAISGKRSANKAGNGKVGTVAKVGGKAIAGAAIGGAIGTIAGAAKVKGTTSVRERRAIKANDPNLPLRHIAERYVNFVTNLQSEVVQMDPFENVKNNKEQAAQQGEGGE